MNTAARPANDLRSMLQELKGNRRTQVALLAFALVLAWMVSTFWPSAPKRRAASAAGPAGTADPRVVANVNKLPKLSVLDKAGELPPMPKLVRDLFMFDAPVPPPPPQVYKAPPPPPPETPEQAAARILQQQKNDELNSKPQDLKYLGFLKGAPSGQVAAFMKGEEPVTLNLGAVLQGRWKLAAITENEVRFQNLKFEDLGFSIQASDSSANPALPSNNF